MKEDRKTDCYVELAEISEILEGLDFKIQQLKSHVDRSIKEPSIVLGRAKNHYRGRRMREKIFANPRLFGEPAWDMLIDLFIAYEEKQNVSVTSLYIASRVPGATAHRWIAILEDEGLVYRTADPKNNRRIFIALTEKGLLQVRSHFEQHGN
jgi:predicted transcriptional regulator